MFLTLVALIPILVVTITAISVAASITYVKKRRKATHDSEEANEHQAENGLETRFPSLGHPNIKTKSSRHYQSSATSGLPTPDSGRSQSTTLKLSSSPNTRHFHSHGKPANTNSRTKIHLSASDSSVAGGTDIRKLQRWLELSRLRNPDDGTPNGRTSRRVTVIKHPSGMATIQDRGKDLNRLFIIGQQIDQPIRARAGKSSAVRRHRVAPLKQRASSSPSLSSLNSQASKHPGHITAMEVVDPLKKQAEHLPMEHPKLRKLQIPPTSCRSVTVSDETTAATSDTPTLLQIASRSRIDRYPSDPAKHHREEHKRRPILQQVGDLGRTLCTTRSDSVSYSRYARQAHTDRSTPNVGRLSSRSNVLHYVHCAVPFKQLKVHRRPTDAASIAAASNWHRGFLSIRKAPPVCKVHGTTGQQAAVTPNSSGAVSLPGETNSGDLRHLVEQQQSCDNPVASNNSVTTNCPKHPTDTLQSPVTDPDPVGSSQNIVHKSNITIPIQLASVSVNTATDSNSEADGGDPTRPPLTLKVKMV